MTFGEKLQHLRTAAGMSQEDLAERLSVSRQAISKWELNKTVPDAKYIVALSGLFGVTTDYLLKDAEGPSVRKEGPTPTPDLLSLAHLAPGLSDRACIVLVVGCGLFAMLDFLYLGYHCLGFPMGSWPLWVVLLGTPVILVIAFGLVSSRTPPPQFRRGTAICFTLWGFSISLLLGFAEVVDDLLFNRVSGAMSIPLFLLVLAALLLPLWCTGLFLANRILQKRR